MVADKDPKNAEKGGGKGGTGARPWSGKTARTSKSKRVTMQRADHGDQGGNDGASVGGSWLTEELLMMFEDEDGEFINFTPSMRSRVTYAPSTKVPPRRHATPTRSMPSYGQPSRLWSPKLAVEAPCDWCQPGHNVEVSHILSVADPFSSLRCLRSDLPTSHRAKQGRRVRRAVCEGRKRSHWGEFFGKGFAQVSSLPSPLSSALSPPPRTPFILLFHPPPSS